MFNEARSLHYQDNWLFGEILPPNWSWKWKEGVGNSKLTTRFKSFYKEHYGTSMSSNLATTIGNLCNQYMVETPINLQFSDDMDWSAGEFGDGGSCFWGSNQNARDFIRDDENFFTVKFLGEEENGVRRGYARAILYAPQGEGYVIVYNGYGLQTTHITGILSSFLKVNQEAQFSFSFDGEYDSLMWINNRGKVGVLYPLDKEFRTVNTPRNVYIGLSEEEECYTCGESAEHYIGDTSLCYSCYSSHLQCEYCGDVTHEGNGEYVDEDLWYCDYCIRHHVDHVECYSCRELVTESVTSSGLENTYCLPCADTELESCQGCNSLWEGEYDLTKTRDTERLLCTTCIDDMYKCERCSSYYENSEVCPNCAEEPDEEPIEGDESYASEIGETE